MFRMFCSLFLVLGMALSLAGCADLDVALYGSQEKADIAREEFQAKQRDKSIKKQREMEAQMHEMIRNTRKQNGVATGRPIFGEGQDIAQIRAQELSESFSKYRPQGRGMYYTLNKEVQARVAIKKELRAKGSDPKKVLDGWMKDPESRAILLNRNTSGFGVGVYEKNYTYYWAFELY